MHSDIGPEFLMTRARLFAQRFAATGSLLLLAFMVIRFLWFPGGFFQISGIAKLLLVLVAVNLVVGPGLSALLYKPGKWGLKFDLIIVACIEIAILGWAMHEISERRPAFVVFAVDRFETVTVAEVDPGSLNSSQFAERAGALPRLVYAELPTDADAMSRLIDDTVILGMQDIDRRPEFWKPYAAGMAFIKEAAMPLSALASLHDKRAGSIERWLARQELTVDDYLYLPVRGRAADGMMILHADIGYPVEVLAIDPW
jgi:hypothetical protein